MMRSPSNMEDMVMVYLDVEVLSEAIRRVDKKLKSMGCDPEADERAILIALAYERLIRGETQTGFFELYSPQARSLDEVGTS